MYFCSLYVVYYCSYPTLNSLFHVDIPKNTNTFELLITPYNNLILRKIKYLLISAFLLTLGCNSIEEPIAMSGPSYYPLEIDKYIIYLVTEYTHDAFRKETDTTYFWQKELLEDTFTDISGSLVYKMALSISKDSGKNWRFDSYAIVEKDSNSAIRTENNTRKTILSFPFRELKTWDVNALNNQDLQLAKIKNIEKSMTTILGMQFAKSVLLELSNQVDPILTNIENEVYAEGVGLIERKYAYIETQPGKYKSGMEYVKTIYETNWE